MSECAGKKQYRSKADALVSASMSLRFDNAGPNELRPYRCPRCKGWHITKWKTPADPGVRR